MPGISLPTETFVEKKLIVQEWSRESEKVYKMFGHFIFTYEYMYIEYVYWIYIYYPVQLIGKVSDQCKLTLLSHGQSEGKKVNLKYGLKTNMRERRNHPAASEFHMECAQLRGQYSKLQ